MVLRVTGIGLLVLALVFYLVYHSLGKWMEETLKDQEG